MRFDVSLLFYLFPQKNYLEFIPSVKMISS